jgi:hypothetical protein
MKSIIGKLTFLFLLLSCYLIGFSQKQNLIKINFLSPLVKTFNVQYEHALSEKSSVQLGLYYTGAKSGDVTLNGIGITPEYRMYFSSENSAPAGFYLAPFLRYQSFTLKADVYNNEGTTVEGKANLSSFRPGLLIGYQWVFSDIVSFEMFLGPSYSFSSYKIKSEYGDESDFSTTVFDGFGLRTGLTIGIAF